MRNRKVLPLAVIGMSLLLAGSCWRRQRVGDAPRLPEPPKSNGRTSEVFSVERFGFLFVLFTETGEHFVQLSETVNREPAAVPKEELRISQIVPTLLLLHPPREPIHPELEGREYVIMRGQNPACRAAMAKPLEVGQLVPGSHEWNEWEVEPWEDPRPPIADVEKKIPMDELWTKSYVFAGGPLSCSARRQESDYDKVFWARPADMPPPRLLTPEIPAQMRRSLQEEAVRRLNDGGFTEKVRQAREDMGEEIEPNIDVAMWTDDRVVFVEVRASIGDGDCGGAAHQAWILWKVTDSLWEEVAREDSLRQVGLIGDFNDDGKYEIVIRDTNNYNSFSMTLYQMEGLYLKKLMRMEYPSYEAVC